MVITNPNRNQDLEYSTVEFKFINATNNAVNVDLFDSNILDAVPAIGNTTAFPDTLGQQLPIGAAYDGIVYDPVSGNVFVGNNSGTIKSINPSNGNTVLEFAASVAPIKMIYVSKTDRI